jgi:hypothetical protein
MDGSIKIANSKHGVQKYHGVLFFDCDGAYSKLQPRPLILVKGFWLIRMLRYFRQKGTICLGRRLCAKSFLAQSILGRLVFLFPSGEQLDVCF